MTTKVIPALLYYWTTRAFLLQSPKVVTTVQAFSLTPQYARHYHSASSTPSSTTTSSSAATTILKMSQDTTSASSSSPLYKRAKLETEPPSTKVIGTHSGTFQADEAMGVFLLQQLPEYRSSPVVRSRDLQVLRQCDIVLDVGGTYDHEQLQYDHHQRDYNERFDPERCTKLSASGLVYRHYGKNVIQQYYPSLTPELVQVAYVKIYDKLLQALDAIDTGVEMVPDGVEALYRDSTGLASRVGRLNPRWNEVTADGGKPEPDQRFAKAVALCGQDFVAVMTSVVESDLPARAFVEQALLQRMETDPSGEILAFKSGGMPWRDHLYELEKVHKVEKLIKFVLYTDQSGMWRVQAVTVEGKAFCNRLSLPEKWRGVRDADLAGIANIKTARFVHAAGFIGGADEYEDALEMARVALQQQQE